MQLIKIIFILLFLHLSDTAVAQNTINQPLPIVAVGYYRTLYQGIENHLEVSTGSKGILKVLCDNGIVRKGKKGWVVIPKNVGQLTITLKGQDYSEDFIFHVAYAPEPEAYVLAPRNEDSMIDNFKLSTGIMVWMRGFHNQTSFKVDSFDIQFTDSLKVITHRNAGASWDETAKKLIADMLPSTKIFISNIVILSPLGKRQKLYRYLEHWYWK